MYRNSPDALLVLGVLATPAPAITISLDYSVDTPQPYFDTDVKNRALAEATHVFELLLADHLDAITPDVATGDEWTAKFFSPSDGQERLISRHPRTGDEFWVPADTVVVFVGGRGSARERACSGRAGTTESSGSSSWADVVNFRGEQGAMDFPSSDVAPWGGSLAFDTVEADGTPRQWNFDTRSRRRPVSMIFFPWRSMRLPICLVRGQLFRRFYLAARNSPVRRASQRLRARLCRWTRTESIGTGTTSKQYPDGKPQVAAMVRDLPPGTRGLLTDLDVAALDDIGWEIAPPDETHP